MTDFNFLVENSIAGMFVYESDRFVYVNDAFAQIFGYASSYEFLNKQIQLTELMPEASYLTLLQEREKRELSENINSRFMIECYHRDGSRLFIEVFVKTQKLIGKAMINGTVINVTESVIAQKQLSLSEQRYRSLFEHNSNLIYSFDLDGNFDSMNPMVTKMLGYSYEELIHIDFKQFIYPEDLPHTLSNFEDVIKLGVQRSYETRIIHKSGEIRYAHIINLPIYVDQKIVGVYGIARDITELKQYIGEIERQAYLDHLTGLPNRRYFEEKYHQMFAEHESVVLGVIDLDGFKTINDTLGHDVGDEVLKCFSKLLMEVAGDVVIARLGGDEFVFAYSSELVAQAQQIAGELLQRLKQPFYIGEYELYVSASIGISSSHGEELTPQQLVKNADIALYNAKADGKRRISIYSQHHDVETLKRFTLARDIRKALKDHQFHIEYQPKFHIMKNKVCSVEALLRWSHPVWGRVSPEEFIPIAEESGLITELGEWVLETVCKEMKSIVEEYDISVSVNVSVIQIMNKSFLTTMNNILGLHTFPPEKLELEITETALFNSEEIMKGFLHELKDMGVKVSLDDFGTGYSSLSFLQKYDIDIVKLDKSFIHSLSMNEKSSKILVGTLSLLHALGMHVIAEGIETFEHYTFLRNHHCNEVQGYLFSKPVPLSKLKSVMLRIPNSIKRSSIYEGVERRKLFRINLIRETKVGLTIASLKGKPVSVGTTPIRMLNIGPGGLSFTMLVNLPTSSEIVYKFSGVLEGEFFSVLGSVVWREETLEKEFIYGVSFIFKSEKEMNELVRICM